MLFAHWQGDLTAAIVAVTLAAICGCSPVRIAAPIGAIAVVLIGLEKVWLAGLIQIALGGGQAEAASEAYSLLLIY